MATYDVIVASVLLLRTIKGLISELYQILCCFTVLNHFDENLINRRSGYYTIIILQISKIVVTSNDVIITLNCTQLP